MLTGASIFPGKLSARPSRSTPPSFFKKTENQGLSDLEPAEKFFVHLFRPVAGLALEQAAQRRTR